MELDYSFWDNVITSKMVVNITGGRSARKSENFKRIIDWCLLNNFKKVGSYRFVNSECVYKLKQNVDDEYKTNNSRLDCKIGINKKDSNFIDKIYNDFLNEMVVKETPLKKFKR